MRACVVAIIVSAAFAACVLAQDTAAQTSAGRADLTQTQREALQKGTALFIVTAILLLLAVAAVIVASITLRRRVAALQEEKRLTPTDSESLWWKTGEAPEGGDKKKQ